MLKIITFLMLNILQKTLQTNLRFLSFNMNFEHFCKFILLNKKHFSAYQWQKTIKLFKYYRSIIKLNRQKLKLGKVVFIINNFDINQPFQELIALKFVNQDLSESAEEVLKSFDKELR
jgi:hypothetical protein